MFWNAEKDIDTIVLIIIYKYVEPLRVLKKYFVTKFLKLKMFEYMKFNLREIS